LEIHGIMLVDKPVLNHPSTYSCMCNSHILVTIFVPVQNRLCHHQKACTFQRELIKLTQNIYVLF